MRYEELKKSTNSVRIFVHWNVLVTL